MQPVDQLPVSCQLAAVKPVDCRIGRQSGMCQQTQPVQGRFGLGCHLQPIGSAELRALTGYQYAAVIFQMQQGPWPPRCGWRLFCQTLCPQCQAFVIEQHWVQPLCPVPFQTATD